MQQTIRDFMLEDRPITMAIVLDSSGSMRDSMKDVHAGRGVVRRDPASAGQGARDRLRRQGVPPPGPDRGSGRAQGSRHQHGGAGLDGAVRRAPRGLPQAARASRGARRSSCSRTATTRPASSPSTASWKKPRRKTCCSTGSAWATCSKSVLKEFSETTGGRAFFVAKANQLGRRVPEDRRRAAAAVLPLVLDDQQEMGRPVHQARGEIEQPRLVGARPARLLRGARQRLRSRLAEA